MALYQGQVIDCGVDYLTCTSKATSSSSKLREIGAVLVTVEHRAGNERLPWRDQWYSGEYCGSVSYGVGPQGTVLRLSSGIAKEYYADAIQACENVSRVDLQVTIKLKGNCDGTIRRLEKAGIEKEARCKKPRKVRLERTNGRAETLYLGQRQSDRFGRAYDKGVESKLPFYQNCLRLETENKRRFASALAQGVVRHPSPSKFCYYEVTHWFANRLGLSHQAAIGMGLIRVPAKTRDCDRQLAWLRSQVRLPLQDMIRRYGLPIVLDALGLTEYI
jgi:hypothetical protein